VFTANQLFCPELPADLRSLIIDATTKIFPQVHAPDPGWLAFGHARDGGGNRRSDATGPAVFTAIHILKSCNGEYSVL
jgi:hypothetical protein